MVVMPLVAPATDVVDMHRQEIAVLTQELGSCRQQIDWLNHQLEFANRLSYRNITSQPGNQMIRTMYDLRRCIRWFAQDDSRKKVDDSRTDGDDSRKRAF